MANQEPQDGAQNNQPNGEVKPGASDGLAKSVTAKVGATTSDTNGGSSRNRADAVAVVKDAVTDDEVESVIIRGEAEAVKLDSIEKGLTNLWQAAAKPRNGESEPPVMRACVLNLVIFADSGTRLAPVTDVITKLTWSYPCRAIVLVSEPQNPTNDMQASISTHCQQPSPNAKKVCCEQITIRGLGQGSERLPSMVLPSLVPDLPVVLWWPGDPTMDGQTFERLLEDTDRFISDSSHFADPIRSLNQLANLIEARPRLAISDFNWARLTPWRGLVAQFFDEPQMLPYLSNVDSIEVEYVVAAANEQPNLAMSLLLTSWLADKLGWQPAFGLKWRGKTASLILNQNGQPLTITFKGHTEPHNDPGCITSVRLTTSLNDKEAIFAVSLAADSGLAYTMIEENNEPSTRQVMLPKRDDAELLTEELRESNRDATYEACLLMVRNILNNADRKAGKTDEIANPA